MKITLFWEESENKPNYIAVSGKKKRKMLLEKVDEDEKFVFDCGQISGYRKSFKQRLCGWYTDQKLGQNKYE